MASVQLVDQEGNVVQAVKEAEAPADEVSGTEKSGDSGIISDWLSDAVTDDAKASSSSTTRMFKFDDAPAKRDVTPDKTDDPVGDDTQTIADSDTKRIGKKKKPRPSKLPASKKQAEIGENTQEAAAETLRRLFTRGS